MFRRLLMLALLATSLAGPAIALTLQAWPETSPDCSGLPNALREGSTMVCQQAHPFVPNFQIEHRLRCDEACLYTQTMPADMTMWCRFSEAGRAEFATVLEAKENGAAPGVVLRECEVRDRNGAMVPFESVRHLATSRRATSSPIASEEVRPGLSMPKRQTRFATLSSMTKSPCGSPGPCSFGRIPE